MRSRRQASIVPDWAFWPPSRPVAPWEAIALSLNIDPDSLKPSPHTYMAGPGAPMLFLSESFPDADTETAFTKRRDLLAAFRRSHREPLPLQDFATWAASVHLSPIPLELAAYATQGTSMTAEANPEVEHAKIEIQEGSVSVSADDKLAALFDPVSVAALAKMFPDDKWSTYQERAWRNGLKIARMGRAKFNPFHAAIWWLDTKKPNGWDLARVRRTLANNLPTRSLDSKHLVTEQIL